MKTFVFHMGYAKCGSTYLQEEVFPQVPGAKALMNPKSDFLAPKGNPQIRGRAIAQLFTCSPEIWRSPEATGWLFETGTDRTTILSEEALFVSDPSNAHIAAHLAEMARAARGHGFDRFRLIAIHRRQDERIASMYAQNTRHWPHAGQRDFERYCEAFIDPRVDFFRRADRLKYGELARIVADELPPEDVFFIPLELLGDDRPGFFALLSKALDASLSSDDVRAQASNARKLQRNQWAIAPMRPPAAASPLMRLLDRRKNVGRETSFTLPDVLRSRIKDAFAEGNRLLQARFGQPLETLGYF